MMNVTIIVLVLHKCYTAQLYYKTVKATFKPSLSFIITTGSCNRGTANTPPTRLKFRSLRLFFPLKGALNFSAKGFR